MPEAQEETSMQTAQGKACKQKEAGGKVLRWLKLGMFWEHEQSVWFKCSE